MKEYDEERQNLSQNQILHFQKEHADDDVNRYSERFNNIHNMAIRFEKAFDDIMKNSEKMYIKNDLYGW